MRGTQQKEEQGNRDGKLHIPVQEGKNPGEKGDKETRKSVRGEIEIRETHEIEITGNV